MHQTNDQRASVSEAHKRVVEAQFRGSYDGSLNFPQVVASLLGIGVESYRADFRQQEVTAFFTSGASYMVSTAPFKTTHESIPDKFDGDAVRAAIAGVQRGELSYQAFVDQLNRAGCAGYNVWITGRHVSYWGRKGETHVEHFPASDR